MAIAVGDRVRPRLTSATLTVPRLNPQPPVIGTVTRVTSGPPDIIQATSASDEITWAVNASSLQASGVPAPSLDQITPPDAATKNALIDKVVVGLRADGSQYSFEYTGVVVDVYVVNGTPSVLIRSLSHGMFYELPVTNVLVLSDR